MGGAVTVRLDDQQMTLLRIEAARRRCSLAEVLRTLVAELNNAAGNAELLEVWRGYFGANA